MLLWLHGGPGGAEFGPRRKFLAGLEKDWLVVDWEQRGAGRSFRGNETAQDLNVDQLVRDGLELIGLLTAAFAQEKICLVGHSFGTVLGVLIAQADPSRISAYVGTAQAVNWAIQEAECYAWTLAQAQLHGHGQAIRALEAIGAPVEGLYRHHGVRGVEIQRRWLGQWGGFSGDPTFLMKWLGSALLAHDYPLGAKLRFTRGMARSMDCLWPELGQRVDFGTTVPSLAVPVHLYMGAMDRITACGPAREWLTRLEAPDKRLEIVEGIGHLGIFENPARFTGFMHQVLPV